MRFKVGDRVEILPLVTGVGVEEEEIGKVGVVSHVFSDTDVMVKMNEVCKARGCIPEWSVGVEMIKLLPGKNEQLLFSFMK